MNLEMNIFWAIVFLVGGLVILWKSAELLVAGAVSLAKMLGVSSLVIGLTIVAMGTSAPEVAASISAALSGNGDVAIGNVFGSNIANLALVGGLCAIITPIVITRRLLAREMTVMVAVALLLLPFLFNGNLSRIEGFELLIIFATLIFLTVKHARKEAANSSNVKRDVSRNELTTGKIILFIVIGLLGLAIGAKGTIDGAVFLGQTIGLSEAVIGLTIIAVGTSLPELVTCVVAALKGHNDITIGNLVGSNIFNTLLVVGTAGAVRPFSITARLAHGGDYWIMIVVTAGFVLTAILCRRHINRTAGVIFLCSYLAYMTYLIVYTAGI